MVPEGLVVLLVELGCPSGKELEKPVGGDVVSEGPVAEVELLVCRIFCEEHLEGPSDEEPEKLVGGDMVPESLVVLHVELVRPDYREERPEGPSDR